MSPAQAVEQPSRPAASPGPDAPTTLPYRPSVGANPQWVGKADDGRDLFKRGKADFDAGNYRTAEGNLKKLIKSYPTSPYREEAMWLYAESIFARQDYYRAFEQYEELIGQYAGSPHYRDALVREVEIADLFFGPARRRVLGIPLLSGDTEALEILRRTIEHQPAGDLAENALLKIADYHWNKRAWFDAEENYDKYCREHPNGKGILLAEVRRARCSIEKCRGPRYDVSDLKVAHDRLQQIMAKFPADADKEGVPALLEQVRDMQAQSLYEIAARYHRAGQPLAAAFYTERLRQQYPTSTWSQKAGEFLTQPGALQEQRK